MYSVDAVAAVVGDRWVDCLTSSDGMLDFLVRIICCLTPRRPPESASHRLAGDHDCFLAPARHRCCMAVSWCVPAVARAGCWA